MTDGCWTLEDFSYTHTHLRVSDVTGERTCGSRMWQDVLGGGPGSCTVDRPDGTYVFSIAPQDIRVTRRTSGSRT